MEKLDYLSCHAACSWQLICASDTKRHGSVRIDQQTGFGSARLAVPGGLDDPVYPYGNCIVSGAYIQKVK